MATANDSSNEKDKAAQHPFRKAVLRGLGVVSPPLFTILIFAWVISMTQHYVLQPVTSGVREVLVWTLTDVRTEVAVLDAGDPPDDDPQQRANKPSWDMDLTVGKADGRLYVQLDDETFVPYAVYREVGEHLGSQVRKLSGDEIYRAFVNLTYLQPFVAIPFFLAVFTLLLYLLGKFMAAGIGRFFWNRFELVIGQLPLVRNVYSSVKQVSDFLFTEREIEYTRVVAVEYPRKGIWSLGLVTGESMLDIRSAANEPVLSVLMPTSPMPVTGFTVTVLKSETIDLNITIDQAFQFIVSCGVVVPAQQLQEARVAAAALPAPSDEAPSDEAPSDEAPSDEPATSGN